LAWIRAGGSNKVPAQYAGRATERDGRDEVGSGEDVLLTSAEVPTGVSRERPRPAANTVHHEALGKIDAQPQRKSADPAADAPRRERSASTTTSPPETDGWYARQSRGEALKVAPTTHEATHPQPIEPARQVILEWNRDPAAVLPH
jgi:hypothetical protein